MPELDPKSEIEFAFHFYTRSVQLVEELEREGQPEDSRLGGGGELAADLRQPTEDVELRAHHVHLPGEEDVDLGRTAAGGSSRAAGRGGLCGDGTSG